MSPAFLPLAAKNRTLWVQTVQGERGQTLYRDGNAIGRLRYIDPELIEVLEHPELQTRRLAHHARVPGRVPHQVDLGRAHALDAPDLRLHLAGQDPRHRTGR